MRLILLASALLAGAATAFVAPHAAFSPRPSAPGALRMAADGDYDFDVAVIGCGVGGHGAALDDSLNGNARWASVSITLSYKLIG